MKTDLTPLTLTCPIRGVLTPKKKRSADLSALEERHRIDAIRHVLSLGYDPRKFKIEAVVAKFGHGGKNSFRCDFAVLDIDAPLIDMSARNAVEELLKHAVILAEIKRDDGDAEYVHKTQVEPLLKFASRKDTVGLYWDGVNPRLFWKEDDGIATTLKNGPLALLPRPGKSIKAKSLVHGDLRAPESLLDVFSRVEDVLHAAAVSLEERYETLLQLILAKIYDEHQGESSPTTPLVFQDFESIGVAPRQSAIDLNGVLQSAVGFYGSHLPKAIDDAFRLKDNVLAHCGAILAPHLITAANKEVIQTFYMKFAKDLYRWDLAQYFTPPTVTDFIVEVLNPVAGELVKDPACGSADFLVATFHRSRAKKITNASDMPHGADDDRKAVQISVLNMLLNGDGKTNIKEEDSLLAVATDQERLSRDKKFRPVQYSAVVCNPPFGVKIVEKRRDVLRWFDLGHAWDIDKHTGQWRQQATVLPKQEKGLLFAEVCVRQAKPGGRIGIILPNGYLGNRSDKYVSFREWLLRNCKVVSVCGFPRFTFKTSGADVSASVVYLEKRLQPLADSSQDVNYMFNAELIENVGWSVGDKKAAPVFQRLDADGSYLVGADGRKVVKSDFEAILTDIRTSPAVSHFPWLTKDLGLPPHGKGKLGWAIPISVPLGDGTRTLDPKKHSRKYAALREAIQAGPHAALADIVKVIPQGKDSAGKPIRKDDSADYLYVDLDNIGAGEYVSDALRGWQLPSRAKHFAEPLDLYVGAIWSSVGKWCVIEKAAPSNTVVTNGCHRIRLRDGMQDRLLDLCAFFCTEAYRTQMRALARGSDGLAEIHESDFGDVLVPLITDPSARAKVQPLVDSLTSGHSTLSETVAALVSAGTLPIPAQASRPHHSALV
jgi:type I restriction enzyme M protein